MLYKVQDDVALMHRLCCDLCTGILLGIAAAHARDNASGIGVHGREGKSYDREETREGTETALG